MRVEGAMLSIATARLCAYISANGRDGRKPGRSSIATRRIFANILLVLGMLALTVAPASALPAAPGLMKAPAHQAAPAEAAAHHAMAAGGEAPCPMCEDGEAACELCAQGLCASPACAGQSATAATFSRFAGLTGTPAFDPGAGPDGLNRHTLPLPPP